MFAVVDRGGAGGSEEGVVIWHGVEAEAMDGGLEVSGGEAESLPGVISNREGQIETGGKDRKKGGLGRGGDGTVDNGEDDGTIAIDKGLERNRKQGVGLLKARGGHIREADPDQGFVNVRGIRSAGGIESSSAKIITCLLSILYI